MPRKVVSLSRLVIYAETSLPGFFNLALADVEEDGSLDFYSVSNNGDLEKIMTTVAQTMLFSYDTIPTHEWPLAAVHQPAPDFTK